MESAAALSGVTLAAFRSRAHIAALAAAGSGFFVVALLAGSGGGFFPAAWAGAAFASWLTVAAVVALRPRLELGAVDLTMIAGALAFAGWFALSVAWSRSVPSTFDESFRYLAYAGVVAAAAIVVERRTVPHLLGGVTTAITVLCLYALGTRVLPDRLGTFQSMLGYRLGGTIGYWNGLGIFAVIGLLLALGFAARGSRLATRALAGAALPILATTAYFTFSRGAWVAVLVGLVAAFAVDRRRFQLAFATAVLALVPAAGVFLASRADGLTEPGASFTSAVRDGHRLAAVLGTLVLLSAGAAALLGVAERRLRVPPLVRTAWAVTLVVVLLAAVGAAWVQNGSPVELAERTWARVDATPSATSNTGRLFDLSSNGRLGLWHAAWDTFTGHPVAGVGGGTFWQVWAASPRGYYTSTEAHSVYAETLAELGLVGLVVLLFVLVPPVIGAVRARREPLVPFGFAAYAGWVVHAGVDWDWELMGVTVPALVCGVALVASGRSRARRISSWLRGTTVVVAGMLALLAATSLGTSARLAAAQAAIRHGDPGDALASAADARRLAPWSVRPLEVTAAVQLDQGRQVEARDTYRAIVRVDPRSWVAWAHLADLTTGAERAHAIAVVRALDPHYREPPR